MILDRRNSIIVAFSAIGLFFVAITITSYLTSGSSAVSKLLQNVPEQRSAFLLNKFHRSEIQAGKKIWEIEADKGQLFPDTNTAQIDNAFIHFYQKDGKVVTLSAPSALVTIDGASLSKAEVSGGVHLTYGEQYVIDTPKALYDREAGTVYAKEHTKLVSNQAEVSGEEVYVNLNDRSVIIKKNVVSKLYGKKKSN